MKNLIAAVIILFFGNTAISQEIDLGVKAGVNFATITDIDNLSSKTGFQAGVFAGIKFNDRIGVQADILYSQQGAKVDVAKFDLNYVNVSVVLKVYLFKGLNIQAGPQFGFIIKDEVYKIGNGGVKTDVEKSDVSGVVGAGLDLPFGIRVDARYNFGFNDVLGSTDGKNSVTSIAVGYSFL